MFALATAETQGGHRGVGVVPQRRREALIGPRPRDHLGTVARPDPRLIGLDDRVDGRRIEVPLVSEDRFERPYPKLDVGQLAVTTVGHAPTIAIS